MPCVTPLKAYRGPEGSIVFDSKKGYLDLSLQLPCGKCIGCRLNRAREWSLRAVHESELHERNSFVTLTYSNEHVPANGSLDKTHWQAFAKKFRKVFGPFRFLMCGEYGDHSYRPHYHALIFGHDFHLDRIPVQDKGDYFLYSSPALERVWGKGFVTIGNLTRVTAEYVARYTLKKVRGDVHMYTRLDLETGEEYEVAPEFALMSRRPGIGAGWYDRFRNDFFPVDECVHEGKSYGVPRYYYKRLEKYFPEEFVKVKADRRRKAIERGESMISLPRVASGEGSPERLAVKEEIALARVGESPRSL